MVIRKAVFPVAGLGTRFLPATKAQPKEMLPVVDKPLVQYAVEEAYAAGVREMIFVVGRHRRPIEEHFGKAADLEATLQKTGQRALLAAVQGVQPADMQCHFVQQAQPLGLGHAVLQAKALVGAHPFAVLLADDLMVGTPPVLAQLVQQFQAQQACVIAVQEVPAAHSRRYGMVAGELVAERLMSLTAIVEKPAPEVAPSRWGVAGRYVLTPDIFAQIEGLPRGVGGEVQLTDAIAALLQHEKVFAYRYEGRRFDCGSKLGFLQANVQLALAHPELGPEFAGYLKSLVA
jgi:UTP--glucose-1-phosphate uridylyltransferase